jgi:hypothetical protein
MPRLLNIFLLVICLFQIGAAAQTEAGEVEVTVAPKVIGSVNPDLYGFGGVDLRYCDISDPGFLKAAISLSPKVIRFPFGQFGNFYHWKESGYGFKKEEIDKVRGGVHKSVSGYFRMYQAQNLKNMADQFIDFHQHSGSKVLLIANILNGSEDELLQLIAKFKKNKVDLAGIELGNELYLWAYRDQIPDVTRYMELAARFARAIRQRYPDIKLAVTAAPADSFEDKRGTGQLNYFNEWNTSLARENFYDAVVVHSYKSFANCGNSSSVRDRFMCAEADAGKFLESDLESEIRYYVNIFGPKRKLWLTEWNMKESARFGNTMLHALYAAEFLLNLTESGAGDAVEFANYWVLCARPFGYAVINPSYSEGEKSGEGSHYTKKTAYYSFQLLKDIFRRGVVKVETSVATRDIERPDDVKVYAFWDTRKGYLYIYTLNKGRETYSLKLTLKDGLKADAAPWQYGVIKGDALFATMGKDETAKEEAGSVSIISGSAGSGPQTIYPFSFGYIRLKVGVR